MKNTNQRHPLNSFLIAGSFEHVLKTLKFVQKTSMVLERTENEIIIRLPKNINWEDLELMLKLIRYKQLVSKSKATQEDIDKLAREANKQWWEENKHRFLKP